MTNRFFDEPVFGRIGVLTNQYFDELKNVNLTNKYLINRLQVLVVVVELVVVVANVVVLLISGSGSGRGN